MNNDVEIKKDDEISLKEILLILLKRKWWFIGSALIILMVGLLYVFLKPAGYLSTYQIELKGNYANAKLSELYPDYIAQLNYLLPATLPVVFKAESGFETLDLPNKEGIDYNGLRKSESVKIALIAGTSIFNISAPDLDRDAADKIGKTIIDAFDNSIKNKEKTILNEIAVKISQDIKVTENKNDNYINKEIAGLEDKLNSLYLELQKYIVDYNINLSTELGKNKTEANIFFYNIIMPPNYISNEISQFQDEMNFYKQEIVKNKIKIIDLNNLQTSLSADENIITNRIGLFSEKPIYSTQGNRLRDLAIVIVLSLLAGAAVVFIVNFGFTLKKEKLPIK